MKKILLLTTALVAAVQLMAQQPTTMLLKTTNNNVLRTDVSEIEKITFTDSTYNKTSTGYRIIEPQDLCWPEDRLLPCFIPPTGTIRTLDLPAAGLSDTERVMFATFQGIINRTYPRIILYNHNEEPRATWPTTANNLKLSTVSTGAPYTLIKSFKNEINGLVLYSTEKSNHYANLAATIAGLDRLLPVTAAEREKLIANGMDYPVVTDLTGLTYSTAADVYNYLYNNYWQRCNHRLLISERPVIPYVHDIAAACGSACVYLDPRTASEKTVLDKFLKEMTPGRDFVLGWYAEERSGVGEATRYGLSTVPADFFENATVYSAVTTKSIKISPVPKRGKLENKVYAAVYISDGDNIQYCQHAMAKIFEQSGRGKLPLNWTISPSLAEFAPQMLNYYYRKATTNDCFVSGPSGMGYAMPYNAGSKSYYAAASNSKLLAPYCQLTQRYIEKSGLRVITVWDDISTVQRRNYAQNCPYLYGLTVNDTDGSRTASTVLGLSIAPQYPWYEPSAEGVANHFNRDIKKWTGTAPLFVSGQVTVWECGPDKLASLPGLLDNLSPGNVKLCRADHWFSYYNEAKHLAFNLTLLDYMTLTSSEVKTNIKYAADGSPSDGYMWVSKETNGTGWVQMDFQEEFKITRYVIRHAEAGGLEPQLNSRDYTVETSLDGETWTTVGTHVGNTEAVNDVTITGVQARYVRVNVTKGGTDGYVRIADIEVYGSH